MSKKKILLAGIILACLLVYSGCGSDTKKQTREAEIEVYKQEIAAQKLKYAQDVNSLQDEKADLIARLEKLAKQLEVLQIEFDAYKQKISEPGDTGNWEQKYKKLEKDNEDLRKLVQYERGLREDLLKKIEKDQATINELKNRLEE